MSLFNLIDTVAASVLENKINNYVDSRISAGASLAMRFFSIFTVMTCIFLILSTVLFIIPFSITQVIASIMVLAVTLTVVIALIVGIFKAIPHIIVLRELLRGRYDSSIIYHGTSSVIDELIDNLPGIIVRILIMTGVFALSLFVMRKIVLGSVEDVSFFKLLVFPFTLSFDTIFGTDMSVAMMGQF